MSILFDRDDRDSAPSKCHQCGRAFDARNPDYAIDHDSLHLRFEHVQGRLTELLNNVPSDVRWRVGEVMALVKLIRGQALK